MSSNIRFISHEDLDKTKWNSCVHYANRGRLYGYWWYLKSVVKEWDAIVEGDYETVFPLFNKKQSLRGEGLYQPDLIRETGIYSVHVLSPKRIENLFTAIPEEYQNIDIILNEGLQPPEQLKFNISKKTNHQLFLNTDYQTLSEAYSPLVHQQLEAARKNNLIITTNLKPEKVADFYKKYTIDKKKEENFHAYQRIMYNALHRGWGFASGIAFPNEEICSAAFFVFSQGRLLRLLSFTTTKGREQGAEALMFDMLLRTNSNRPLVLDFNTEKETVDPTQYGAEVVTASRIQKKKKILGVF